MSANCHAALARLRFRERKEEVGSGRIAIPVKHPEYQPSVSGKATAAASTDIQCVIHAGTCDTCTNEYCDPRDQKSRTAADTR
jgi:hypothetical protein